MSGICPRCGQSEPDAPFLGNKEVADTLLKISRGTFTLMGIKEMRHKSGRRIEVLAALEIGWDSQANGYRCYEGEEVVATVVQSKRAVYWLLTGEWDA